MAQFQLGPSMFSQQHVCSGGAGGLGGCGDARLLLECVTFRCTLISSQIIFCYSGTSFVTVARGCVPVSFHGGNAARLDRVREYVGLVRPPKHHVPHNLSYGMKNSKL